ncbi:MAG TPA: HD domain-containing protein [Polyangiaceae bacterium]|nr:HD domain-containing protein [Polyangiaceae bacterium]
MMRPCHDAPVSEPVLITRARELARAAHAGQVRKAGNTPYFEHLEAVEEVLEAHGFSDPVVIAAALLHDLLEDQPAFEPALRAEMPEDVLEIVEVLTEPKLDERGHPRPKRERFEAYLAQLEGASGPARRAIPISCADKIHNLRSLVAAHAAGDSLLVRLSTRPGQHAAQLRALREVYAPEVSGSLLKAFDSEVAALERTLHRWLPGRAVALAAEAHLGQFDKAGAPYIEHPLRLMLRARSPEEKMTAVLHDVVEDSPWTLAQLADEGFPADVVAALDRLTRRSGESYDAFISRVAEDPLATRVKLLDLEDNADLSRIGAPTDHDRERAEKYQRSIERLRRGSARSAD